MATQHAIDDANTHVTKEVNQVQEKVRQLEQQLQSIEATVNETSSKQTSTASKVDTLCQEVKTKTDMIDAAITNVGTETKQYLKTAIDGIQHDTQAKFEALFKTITEQKTTNEQQFSAILAKLGQNGTTQSPPHKTPRTA